MTYGRLWTLHLCVYYQLSVLLVITWRGTSSWRHSVVTSLYTTLMTSYELASVVRHVMIEMELTEMVTWWWRHQSVIPHIQSQTQFSTTVELCVCEWSWDPISVTWSILGYGFTWRKCTGPSHWSISSPFVQSNRSLNLSVACSIGCHCTMSVTRFFRFRFLSVIQISLVTVHRGLGGSWIFLPSTWQTNLLTIHDKKNADRVGNAVE